MYVLDVARLTVLNVSSTMAHLLGTRGSVEDFCNKWPLCETTDGCQGNLEKKRNPETAIHEIRHRLNSVKILVVLQASVCVVGNETGHCVQKTNVLKLSWSLQA